MVKVEIFLKEHAENQLIVSVEPHTENCTDLEKAAAMVLKAHIEAALRDFQHEAKQFILDLEGEAADEWRRKLLG